MGKFKEIIEKLKKSNIENTPEFKTAEKAKEIAKDLENDIIQSILIFLKNHKDRNEDINYSYVMLVALALATRDLIKTFHKTGCFKDGYNCQDVLEHYKTDVLDNIFDMDEEECPKS